MKNIIKSSQATRFRRIGRIVYEIDNMDLWNTNYRKIYIPSESNEDVILRCWDMSEKLRKDYFQLNVSGRILDFEYITCRYHMVAFNQCNKESVFESIHNYFLDFFGDTVKNQWIVNNYMPYFPRLPNLSLILIFWGTGNDKGNMKNLQKIISSSPTMTHIKMSFWEANETLKPESKFYQAESIAIQQDNLTVPVNLGSFQGRQTFFRCNTCRNFDLIEFVNRWKSGEAFQKLEHLEIVIDNDDIPINRILDEIGVKYIDATKTPPTHTLPKVYFETVCKPNTYPINAHTYVVRETDNRVASISIQEKTLSFGVWSETEEEFLAMVKLSQNHVPIADFHPKYDQSVFGAIHNYFLDFFGNSIEYIWIARLTHGCKLLIPRLQNLSECVYTSGFPELSTEEFEKILSSSSVFKLVNMDNLTRVERFGPESKLCQVESIQLKLNDKAILDVLHHFQGRQAFFTCSSSFEIEGWTEFVDKWKSGEVFQKLEYLRVKIPSRHEFPQTEILNAVGVNYIDATKTPPTHSLPKVHSWRVRRRYTDPIISHTYVVRETDNRVASISIQQTTILFGVWNKTEEEFLAMVK
ncbi:hypothetical protein B9Z55_009041 [Caenorhabditis nigoni]|nr:hypothetical protein B9Z55_009041 [Caenorhabditis nigoni]